MAINNSLPIVAAIAGLGAALLTSTGAAADGPVRSFVVGALADSPADAAMLRQRAPLRVGPPIGPRQRPVEDDEAVGSTNYQPSTDTFPERRVIVLARPAAPASLPGSADHSRRAAAGCDELTRRVLDSNDDGYRESVQIACD